MLNFTRRRGRTVTAPVLINPYEEETAGFSAFSLPPRCASSAECGQQTAASPRVPAKRGSGSVFTASGRRTDAMGTSTSSDMGTGETFEREGVSCQYAPRPSFAGSARHVHYALPPSQRPTGQNLGTTRGENVDNSAHDDGGGGALEPAPSLHQPPTPSPQEHHRHLLLGDCTQQNPFRFQTFEAFCRSPDYSVPPDCRADQNISDAWTSFSRATEGGFCDQCTLETSPRGYPRSSKLFKHSVDAACLKLLRTGDRFYKWTKGGNVHERYVWLDAQRETLLWGSGPQCAVVLLSQLHLHQVVELRPDCLFDEATQRTFYRFLFTTKERAYVFATEMRDKFDVWFDALNQVLLACREKQRWEPLGVSAAAARGSRWSSRTSPLHAVLHGHVASVAMPTANGVFAPGVRGRVLPSD